MSAFDWMGEQRRREEERERMFREHVERLRADLERARAEGEREQELREREREIDRLQHEHERETERERRREERRARHAARHSLRFQGRGFGIGVDVDPDEIARKVSAAFSGMDDEEVTGESFDETVDKTFTVQGMPRVRVRNVSGETTVRKGADGEVHVVARKRVRGGSSDRAKRLLQNVEVRIEQSGNDIYVEPHLYEQERGWLDLFRGKKFRVDFEVTVPRESAVDAQTVSGDLSLSGTRGPTRVESVSGDVNVSDVQGPMRLKSVSGDVECHDYVGAVEGSSVSGDVSIRGRVRNCELHTVSGDITIDLEPATARESRLKTISGDVEIGLLGGSCACDFRTASGDLDCEVPARVIREGRKDRAIVVGEGRGRVQVKTVSGDLTIRGSASAVVAEPAASAEEAPPPSAEPGDVEATAPMPQSATVAVRELLERVARGELSVDEAASKLDETRPV